MAIFGSGAIPLAQIQAFGEIYLPLMWLWGH